MIEKSCCFTGHRIIADNLTDEIKTEVFNAVESLIKRGYTCFISGGAMGFDLIAAVVVLALRKKYDHIKLLLVLPCKNQDSKWNTEQRTIYKYVVQNADEVRYLYEAYVTGCMQARNREMVNNSSVCIAYLKYNRGGTKSTVDYAITKNREVIYI